MLKRNNKRVVIEEMPCYSSLSREEATVEEEADAEEERNVDMKKTVGCKEEFAEG